MFEPFRSSIARPRSIFGWLGVVSVAIGVCYLLFTADHPPLSMLFIATAFILFAIDGRRKKSSEPPRLSLR